MHEIAKKMGYLCTKHAKKMQIYCKMQGDSLWLYDNDNEDEDYAAKLRGGESACGTGKATKVAVKLAQKQFYRVDYLSTELKQN